MFAGTVPPLDAELAPINRLYRADERSCVLGLLAAIPLEGPARARAVERAARWVEAIRARDTSRDGLDAFLSEYDLGTHEGVMLMCLAESLLRIPDADTATRLIGDKLAGADWAAHLGEGSSAFVNASTWALLLTGRIMSLSESDTRDHAGWLRRFVGRAGEPVVRRALRQAMRILGRQFVMGRTIEEALERASPAVRRGDLYSFDMLGEAALTQADAERYFGRYERAIAAIGRAESRTDPVTAPGISVKLSALHPRFEPGQHERVLPELGASVTALARAAKARGIALCIDAEEADRLDLSLRLIASVAREPALRGWDGLGLAVQAYQKRAPAVVDWAAQLARSTGRRLMVRLVKGAYWDTEIKRAQERGLDGYPVFTRKENTDVSYLACAARLLAAGDAIHPQFATHNAHTVSTVLELAGPHRPLEFQRLHGMGQPLYDTLRESPDGSRVTCRVYAPVGGHEDLLAYLVRRLLENGANTSFVNRIVHAEMPAAAVVADPVDRVASLKSVPHPRIPLPGQIFAPERANSRGVDLSDPADLAALASSLEDAWTTVHASGPVIGGRMSAGDGVPVHDPADRRRTTGTVRPATEMDLNQALSLASGACREWDSRGGGARADCLDRAADLLESRRDVLVGLCVREAGRTLEDSLSEVREAVDACRYYAQQARTLFAAPETMRGPTGETNTLSLHGRGVFACISPWNFPVAIFTGQIAAALAAGNAVVAKPAEQTPLVAARVVRILHEAGVPPDVLHLLPGDGETLGTRLVGDGRVDGVAFTGSTTTAEAIARTLADRGAPIVPLIAETGGQNAMIVDSSALPEQVVADVVTSAFRSAGQRCSCLRVLFLQEDVAPRILEMLAGAMDELVIGDPGLVRTDIGPVIDADAVTTLARHVERLRHEARVLHEPALPADCVHGTYFAPVLAEIPDIRWLEREVFGPVLHVVRYRAKDLDQVLDAINATRYGLTLGIHTRIDSRARYIHRRVRAGNTYVNRNMIGAVIGVQPFGGEGLSGTGPKAGGPNYLPRFAVERTFTVNTTASGGNATLMSLEEAPRLSGCSGAGDDGPGP
ncbi:MAG: bifunctional proline dehydrogenase/L-glutamate gamma-semialdehyde dehydrogenase PutA [Betaproteobacteria bacterium]|nr:bifunctional proline dehydrogenase/L-glutamate gamma-semialdehyde dehydrogenase PutA [Betaproteobacteria bacterium]